LELTRIQLLREDVKVWLVYAGTQRRFFEDFRASNSIFLNIPGFDAFAETFNSDEGTRQHLAMSDAVSSFIRGQTNVPPSRNAGTYNPYPYQAGSSDARSFAAELGNIHRMFVEALPGDLVISPAQGHFEPFLIGEVVGGWSKAHDLVVARLQGETVPTRRVRWLNVALARRDFSVRTSKRLQNRHAITLLDEDYYADVFDTVYPSYAWRGRSKLDLFGDGYSGKDPMQPFLAAKLLKYVIASVFAYTDARMDQFQAMEIDDAIAAFYDEALIEDLHLNFNSPGKFSVISRRGALSVLAATGLLVATGEVLGEFEGQKQQAAEQVNGSVSGNGQGDANQEVDNYLQSMDSVRWKHVQNELGGPANQSLGLSLDNRVEVATHRAELNAN
jgi:hypothetical protein